MRICFSAHLFACQNPLSSGCWIGFCVCWPGAKAISSFCLVTWLILLHLQSWCRQMRSSSCPISPSLCGCGRDLHQDWWQWAHPDDPGLSSQLRVLTLNCTCRIPFVIWGDSHGFWGLLYGNPSSLEGLLLVLLWWWWPCSWGQDCRVRNHCIGQVISKGFSSFLYVFQSGKEEVTTYPGISVHGSVYKMLCQNIFFWWDNRHEMKKKK